MQGAELAQARSEVAELIIRLWSHRRVLPTRASALAAIDGVERAIARLDPERPSWGYYSAFGEATAPGEQVTEADAFLGVALAIDRAAGDVVHALVGYAATSAQDADAEWVQHGLRVGDETLQRIRRIRFNGEAADAGAATLDDWTAVLAQSAALALSLLHDLNAALDGADRA